MKVVVVSSTKDRVRKVRKLIQSAGNQIGNIHFFKRSDGTKRKMSFRLHVRKPSYCRAPEGGNIKCRKAQDEDKNLLTVYDTNTVRYNQKDKMNGRGGYKSIPLDTVTRVSVGGVIYKIVEE